MVYIQIKGQQILKYQMLAKWCPNGIEQWTNLFVLLLTIKFLISDLIQTGKLTYMPWVCMLFPLSYARKPQLTSVYQIVGNAEFVAMVLNFLCQISLPVDIRDSETYMDK